MYFEKLNNHQKQFLQSLGISSDKDMLSEFFGKIKSLNTDLSKEEQFCVSDYNKIYCYIFIEIRLNVPNGNKEIKKSVV